jgi:alkylated DNA nucleotide flippase Atl1
MAARIPRSVGTPSGSDPSTDTLPWRRVIVADGRRPMNDQRPQVPACSTDSRMKPGSSWTKRE